MNMNLCDTNAQNTILQQKLHTEMHTKAGANAAPAFIHLFDCLYIICTMACLVVNA